MCVCAQGSVWVISTTYIIDDFELERGCIKVKELTWRRKGREREQNRESQWWEYKKRRGARADWREEGRRGNAEHVRMWTESNPGRDALRQRGRGRVNGKQLTEGLIMKTRQEMEGCLACRWRQKERSQTGKQKRRGRGRKETEKKWELICVDNYQQVNNVDVCVCISEGTSIMHEIFNSVFAKCSVFHTGAVTRSDSPSKFMELFIQMSFLY